MYLLHAEHWIVMEPKGSHSLGNCNEVSKVLTWIQSPTYTKLFFFISTLAMSFRNMFNIKHLHLCIKCQRF